MTQLATVLDELDRRVSDEGRSDLPHSDVQRLIAALQSEGGEMARIASVIETLARENIKSTPPLRFASPNGSVMMPGSRTDVRTQTAGNGVMTGTGT